MADPGIVPASLGLLVTDQASEEVTQVLGCDAPEATFLGADVAPERSWLHFPC